MRSPIALAEFFPHPNTVPFLRLCCIGVRRAIGTFLLHICISSPAWTSLRYSLRWFLKSAMLAIFMAILWAMKDEQGKEAGLAPLFARRCPKGAQVRRFRQAAIRK